MKKTIQVNIGGSVFQIDEDAFEKVNKYIDQLTIHFSKEEGAEEIMQDIEQRIAEIFKEMLGDRKEVLTIQNVQQMMDIMGQPDVISEQSTEEPKKNSDTKNIINKRLFRDPDNQIMGGVCSGLGAYFGIDPVIFRLIFAFSFVVWGTGLLFYLILWMAMPKAKTTADKLEMRGEPITISAIEKKVKKEMQDIEQRFEDPDFKKRTKNKFTQILHTTGDLLTRIFGVFMKGCLALFILFWIFILASILFAVVFGEIDFVTWSSDVYNNTLSDIIFQSTQSVILSGMGMVSFILILGVPIVLLLMLGSMIIFKREINFKWAFIILGILWTVGLIMGVITISQLYF
jgi:phage shock protein PspC (stress-responsive transcriptional regulator)